MHSDFPVFQPASPSALAIYELFVQVLIVSAAIFAIVAGLIVVAVYRGCKRAALPEQDFGNEKAEIAWMVGPILIVIWLAVASAGLVLTINAVPKAHPPGHAEADLVVTAHQWWWDVRYADSQVVSVNEIHIPIGKPLRVRLESADVIHCFWVPQLARKMDVIPGQDNYLWLQADQAGVYQGRCAEYCGIQHAWMEFKVYAHAKEEYQSWLAARQSPPAKGDMSEAATRGKAVFMERTCANCHAIGGTEAIATIAPDLSHVASRGYLGGGAIENSSENLRLWLKNPDAIKPGCKMPNFNLSDEQLDELVAYLETLK